MSTHHHKRDKCMVIGVIRKRNLHIIQKKEQHIYSYIRQVYMANFLFLFLFFAIMLMKNIFFYFQKHEKCYITRYFVN